MGKPARRAVVAAAILACAIIRPLSGRAPADWPQFRGPGSSGVADASKLPLRWTTTENIAWVTEIPGRGWSSPVIAGSRVFVTAAINSGAFKAPSTGIYGNDLVAELVKQGLPMEEVIRRVNARDIEVSAESSDVRYVVYALDAATGKVVWKQDAHVGKPVGGRHRKNTYASETPATDGERLFVSFGGNVGLFAYSLSGDLLWKKTWPPQPIYLDFGTASSPVVHDGRVYQLFDNERESFLAALDAKTGREVWSVKRAGFKTQAQSGWATPFIWKNDWRVEIITIGKASVVSYGLDGTELWRLSGMTQATPTPVAGDGLLYVGSGSQGENGRPVFAIKPGASGDISLAKGETSNTFVAWFHPRLSGYTPSPLLYRGRIYVINDNGVMQVVDAKTGQELYKARVGGAGMTFSSSPLASQGRIYAVSEDGDVVVFEAADEYKELAKNSLGEMSLATPAADANSLYVRTATKLYKVKN
jgi:outer membrane protein assembly factor BamB